MSGNEIQLSVLDLIPVRRGQSTAQAIAASGTLAERADALGYRRYWFAEHHNMPAVASTAPSVLIALIAGRTRSIRVGSGGVMLPNHAPLVVAEQFSLLEAAFPGRIDLGIGRAPGSDPVTSALLRGGGNGSNVDEFPRHIDDILALMDPDGTAFRLTDGTAYGVHATPGARSVPTVWLLGSSDYSAQLAAKLGLPYVFANHFAGTGIDRALELYRSGFQPSEFLTAPRTILTVNAVVADTEEEARRLALPSVQNFARIQTGQRPEVQPNVEEALAATLSPLQQEVTDRLMSTWIVGDAAGASARIRSLAEQYGIDEVMVSPGAGATADTPLDAAPGRVRTLELLAEAFGIAPPLS